MASPEFRTFRLLLTRERTPAARIYLARGVIGQLSETQLRILWEILRDNRRIAGDWLDEQGFDACAAHCLQAFQIRLYSEQCLKPGAAHRVAAEWEVTEEEGAAFTFPDANMTAQIKRWPRSEFTDAGGE